MCLLSVSETPDLMLWATLQAHCIAKLLLDMKFEGHPDVSVILHQFLIMNSVPCAKHDELAKAIKELKVQLIKVDKVTSAAASVVDNALKKANVKK